MGLKCMHTYFPRSRYDNCGVSEQATWTNPTSPTGVQTRYARMGVALNKTARPIVYSICCPYDPNFVASRGFWVGQPNASQGGGNSWRIGCDMPGADFGIVMIVADVAASWGRHSVTDYAAGKSVFVYFYVCFCMVCMFICVFFNMFL